jgi:hypothetical protein
MILRMKSDCFPEQQPFSVMETQCFLWGTSYLCTGRHYLDALRAAKCLRKANAWFVVRSSLKWRPRSQRGRKDDIKMNRVLAGPTVCVQWQMQSVVLQLPVALLQARDVSVSIYTKVTNACTWPNFLHRRHRTENENLLLSTAEPISQHSPIYFWLSRHSALHKHVEIITLIILSERCK